MSVKTPSKEQLQTIRDAESVNEAIAICTKLEMNPYVDVPKKPYLHRNASAAEARQYAIVLEAYEELYIEYKNAEKSAIEFNNILRNELEVFIKN